MVLICSAFLKSKLEIALFCYVGTVLIFKSIILYNPVKLFYHKEEWKLGEEGYQKGEKIR